MTGPVLPVSWPSTAGMGLFSPARARYRGNMGHKKNPNKHAKNQGPALFHKGDASGIWGTGILLVFGFVLLAAMVWAAYRFFR